MKKSAHITRRRKGARRMVAESLQRIKTLAKGVDSLIYPAEEQLTQTEAIEIAVKRTAVATTAVVAQGNVTSTKAFHEYKPDEVRFLRGRVRFVREKNPASLSTLLLVYKKRVAL